jgi:hypothetical protein
VNPLPVICRPICAERDSTTLLSIRIGARDTQVPGQSGHDAMKDEFSCTATVAGA